MVRWMGDTLGDTCLEKVAQDPEDIEIQLFSTIIEYAGVVSYAEMCFRRTQGGSPGPDLFRRYVILPVIGACSCRG